MRCELCDCELIEKNKKPYGKEGAECHISRHHYLPKRLEDLFGVKEMMTFFGIENKNDYVKLCYQCHEEMIHNIILTPEIINKLSKKMRNKELKERIIILYKQLLK